MPCPSDVKWINLAVCEGVPSFFDVLDAVLDELEVQRGVISSEMKDASPNAFIRLQDLIDDQFPLDAVPHEELKALSKSCKAQIRTGECTPYCNILLEGGVTF